MSKFEIAEKEQRCRYTSTRGAMTAYRKTPASLNAAALAAAHIAKRDSVPCYVFNANSYGTAFYGLSTSKDYRKFGLFGDSANAVMVEPDGFAYVVTIRKINGE